MPVNPRILVQTEFSGLVPEVNLDFVPNLRPGVRRKAARAFPASGDRMISKRTLAIL
jgi:hypothetical protein